MLRNTLRLSARRSLKANRAFATEAGFNYEELFQDSKATKTPFKKLTSDHVSTFEVQSPDDCRSVLTHTPPPAPSNAGQRQGVP